MGGGSLSSAVTNQFTFLYGTSLSVIGIVIVRNERYARVSFCE